LFNDKCYLFFIEEINKNEYWNFFENVIQQTKLLLIFLLTCIYYRFISNIRENLSLKLNQQLKMRILYTNIYYFSSNIQQTGKSLYHIRSQKIIDIHIIKNLKFYRIKIRNIE
jgi:hypothetical protein